MIRKVNGRHARFYLGDDGYIAVTYHKRVGKRVRQLTISDKLMRRVGVTSGGPAGGTIRGVSETKHEHERG